MRHGGRFAESKLTQANLQNPGSLATFIQGKPAAPVEFGMLRSHDTGVDSKPHHPGWDIRHFLLSHWPQHLLN